VIPSVLGLGFVGAASAWFVCQPLQATLQKMPRPLIDKAMADPDGLGNLGEWQPIS